MTAFINTLVRLLQEAFLLRFHLLPYSSDRLQPDSLNIVLELTGVMKVGMLLPSAGEHATRENIIQAAKQAEEERFDSLWAWERLISPLKPQTPYPLTPDGSFPIEFQSLFEPLEH